LDLCVVLEKGIDIFIPCPVRFLFK